MVKNEEVNVIDECGLNSEKRLLSVSREEEGGEEDEEEENVFGGAGEKEMVD